MFVHLNEVEHLTVCVWVLSACNGRKLVRLRDDIFLIGSQVPYVVCIVCISVMTVSGGERQVFNLAPFTDKHFRIRGLGDTIKDLHNLLYLYPDIPKARTFSKFWTQGLFLLIICPHFDFRMHNHSLQVILICCTYKEMYRAVLVTAVQLLLYCFR